MAGYGRVRTVADLPGYADAAAPLQEARDDEGEADKKLTRLAEAGISAEAAGEDGEEEEEGLAPTGAKNRPKAAGGR
jgi:hypothetical protein